MQAGTLGELDNGGHISAEGVAMAQGKNINLLGYVVVSDLHLGPGKHPSTPHIYKHEDFLFDEEFQDFLIDLDNERPKTPASKWRLIINGDFVEFMQILLWPDPVVDDDKEKWELWPGTSVQMSQTEDEKKDGLVTSPMKSAWKLDRMGKGHPKFFKALARFVHAGNDLVLVKGNHDVEFHWSEVREKFVELLVKAPGQQGANEANLDQWTDNRFVQEPERIWATGGTLQFCEYSYCDGPLYAEHGNQHDPSNEFRDFYKPTHRLFSDALGGEPLIEFPLGSIFVRYFFNEVENYFSYADNIKPTSEALREIWKRHPWLVIKILTRRIGPLVRALTFPPVWIRLRKVMKPVYITYVLIALLAILWPLLDAVRNSGFSLGAILKAYQDWRWLSAIIPLALPVFADFLSKQEDRYLRRAAVQKLNDMRKQDPRVHYFVYGHTHDPDIWQMQKGEEEAWYYNTGTWTPVLSWEERLDRPPEQFVFLKIVRDADHISGWQSTLYYWVPQTKQKRALVLKEDSKSVKLKSRSYLAQAGLEDPEPGHEEPFSVVDRAWSCCGARIKPVWECVVGFPALLLWSIICIVAHLIRPFWRLIMKPKNWFSLKRLRGELPKDFCLMWDWIRVSWEILGKELRRDRKGER